MSDTPQETALSLPLSGVASEESLQSEVVALFDQLRAPLLAYLLTLGLPVQDGEEVVQEVFLALFRHLGHGKSRENLRGWMFRVAHNLGLKRLRKRKSWSPVPEAVVIADSAPTPEEAAADQQTHARLKAVVRALPQQDQRCLALRAEGLRYREIARVLDMSLGAVSMSLARSLARLARVAER